MLSQQEEYDPFDSFPASAFVDIVKLEWFLNWYRVDHEGETAYDETIEESKATPLLLFRSIHQFVNNNTNKGLKELLLLLRSVC